MNDQIIIQKIANGWIVVTPTTSVILPGGFTEESFVAMGKAVAKGQGAIDEALDSLREQDFEFPKITARSNEHAFKTFEEVLSFLKYEFGEEEKK